MSSNTPAGVDVKPDVEMSDSIASPLLGKRKRSEDEDDTASISDENEDNDDNDLFMPDDEFIVPDDDSEDDDEERDTPDDDNSDNDVEDHDVPQEPYSESTETYPPCAIYDLGIDSIAERLVGVPKQVLDIISCFGGSGKHVDTLVGAAKKLVTVPKNLKVRIGLLGDAGAGKSSLLNSLTDLDDLAKSLSGGQSCTCVPTEYSSAFPTQRKAFAASIRYFDIKKIRSVLEGMLDDYNLFTFENDRDWDDEQRTQFKRAMQNALKTFRVLFCDLTEFKDDNVAKEFLKANWQDTSVDAIGMFLDSCEKKLKDKITLNLGYAEFIEASTRTRLRDLVDPLTGAKAKGDKPALWPLVRYVGIGVRGSRVLENVTIVDLPGISDTNNVRVELSKQHIKLCDYLWVVAPVKRVVDDGSVYNILAMYGQRFKGKVAVICTHADESVDRKLANHLEDSGCEVRPYFDYTQQWKDKKKEVTKCKKSIITMRNRKKPTKQMILDVQTSEDKLKALILQREAIDATRFEFLVKARATFITAQLQEEMQSHLPGGSALTTFCVSNSHYGSHKGAVKLSGPRLSVEATKVPVLRAHALSLPAPLLMGSLSAFANHTMTVFLKSAHMWVDTTNVERRKELLELVLSIVKALDANKINILEVALQKFEEKKQKHSASVRAFIRKNGNHSSKLCPKDCWNESFTRAIHQLVDTEGQSWGEDFLSNMDVTKGWIIADLQRVLVSIGEQPSATVLPMTKIKELIEAQIVGVEDIFDGIVTEYKKDFGNIALDMTQDSEKNYFSRSMQPIYDSCKMDSGTGVTRRSLDKLEAHLNKTKEDSPFTVLQHCAVKAIIANDEKHVNKYLMAKITKIYKETHAACDRMVGKSTIEDPKEAKARLSLKAAIPKIQIELDAVKKDLLAVKQKYATVVMQ
ncbi:uncharacterized protein RCC_09606 [Ramularia collo-cygni]|uniref:G domain-containing protein n=1 Tax=Ramularia collo-cygni TaxID=112498 RepID=A0A2D3VHZ9_9PEZI|nr:uncharacterized protein RCC_09606 [Ramularia collo-cygni]CZT23891.1 uncharacterized protein RCC_09606 [Ramularia collo-cygni]